MLDPSQHGFRAKHGTDSASLLLVDALEHAKETHTWSPLGTSAKPLTASASPHYKWPRPDWAFPQNGPLSSSSWTPTEPHQYGSRFHNLLMTKQAKQDYPASKPSEQQTSYSPPNKGSPKVMSPAHLDGTQCMTYYYEPSPSNAVTSRPH